MRDLTCREFIEFLDDYVANAQDAEVRAAFEAHLAICTRCADYLRSYRDAIRMGKMVMSESPGPVPDAVPEDLVKAVVAAMRERRP
ncbi:MAG: zf-HC2 domain-containing protein [Phycisphaerales bacterium]